MGKAKRKPRPSQPKWFWYGMDGCWACKNRNNCNQCKLSKENSTIPVKRGKGTNLKGRYLKES